MLIRAINITAQNITISVFKTNEEIRPEDIKKSLYANQDIKLFKKVYLKSFPFLISKEIEDTNQNILFSEGATTESIKKEIEEFAAADYTITVIDSDELIQLPIELPISDSKKAESAIRLELEDLLPYELDFDKFHLSSNDLEKNSSNITSTIFLVTLIEQEKIELFIKILGSLGINSQIISNDLATLYTLALNIHDSINIEKDSTLALINHADSEVSIFSSSIAKNIEIRRFSLAENNDFKKSQITNQLSHFLSLDIDHYVTISTNKLTEFSNIFSEENKNITKLIQNSNHINLSSLIEDIENSIVSTNIFNKLVLASISVLLEIDRLGLTPETGLTSNKKIRLWNIRSGKYKYKEPFSDFRESITGELVPIVLFVLCFILFSLSSFILPSKKINVSEQEAAVLTFSYAPEISTKGKSISSITTEVDNEITNIEAQIGSLTSVRSLSSVDWLYRYSKVIDKNLDFALESFSISTDGLTFRGTAKDYPTSGKLDTLVKKFVEDDPKTFCSASVSSDQGSSVGGKLSVIGEVTLCK